MCRQATVFVLVTALAALAGGPARGQEKPGKDAEATAKSRIVSVGLFKHGLAVVKREVIVPGPGSYRLETDAEPVHGTFWIESDSKVEAAVKMRDVEMPLHRSPLINLQEELGGKKVTIHFRNDKLPPAAGTLLKIESKPSNEPPLQYPGGPLREHFYILQTAKGKLYINPSEIAMVLSEEAGEKVTQRRPVLVLTVGKTDKKPPTIHVTYLAHGLAWAPSYLVDTSDPKTLSVEMAAVVRNEMADIDGAEFRLISGFPSVEFANVISPLAARMTWEKFFQAVQHRGSSPESIFSQQVVLANASFTPQPKSNLGAIPEGEGVDLHFQPIGKHSLLSGEAFSVTVGKAQAAYERVVEWQVGTSPVAHKYGGSGKVQDEMWDVLHFKNPFAFPMTTAPAMVVSNGQFNGQRTSFWANTGEEARLKVTKSLSVRAISREQEDDGQPNQGVVVDGKTYIKIFLKGELLLNNHRKQPVKVIINHTIRGTVLETDGNPRLQTREDSLEQVNRAQDAQWTVTLQPGEEKRLTYRYSVLVYR